MESSTMTLDGRASYSDDEILEFLSQAQPANSFDIEILMFGRLHAGEGTSDAVLNAFFPYIRQYVETSNHGGTSELLKTDDMLPRIVTNFMFLDEQQRFLPQIIESLVLRLRDESMDKDVRFVRQLASMEEVTASILGTVYRRLLAVGDVLAATTFLDQIVWDNYDIPLHLRLQIYKESWTLGDRLEGYLASNWDGLQFRQGFEEQIPELAGFPASMQVKVALKMGDMFPHEGGWNDEAF